MTSQADPQGYREALWWARKAIRQGVSLQPWAVKHLLEALASYESGITWDTTCLNCANLLDQLYETEQTKDTLTAVRSVWLSFISPDNCTSDEEVIRRIGAALTQDHE